MTDQTDQTDQDVEAQAAALYGAVSGLLQSGGILGDDCWATTDQEREALYHLGHGLYEQGRYDDSFKVFSLLVMQDHLEPRYVFGLGCACQMLGRYTDALQHYMAVAVARVDDPLPIFHAAECLIAMSRLSEASDSLVLVLENCSDSQSALYRRAQTLLQRLRTAQQQAGVQDGNR